MLVEPTDVAIAGFGYHTQRAEALPNRTRFNPVDIVERRGCCMKFCEPQQLGSALSRNAKLSREANHYNPH